MKEAGVPVFGFEKYIDNFTVLARTTMPAVLNEYLFHTCHSDVEKLLNGNCRAKMACASVKAICKYFGVKYVEETEPEDSGVYRVQVGGFTQRENANRLKKKLEGKGYTLYIVEVR